MKPKHVGDINDTNDSVNELIVLLNQDNNDDAVGDIYETQEFKTYNSFQESFSVWTKLNNHPMKITCSTKEGGSNDNFPFSLIVFSCKHAGKPRIRGDGKTPSAKLSSLFVSCSCTTTVGQNQQ